LHEREVEEMAADIVQMIKQKCDTKGEGSGDIEIQVERIRESEKEKCQQTELVPGEVDGIEFTKIEMKDGKLKADGYFLS